MSEKPERIDLLRQALIFHAGAKAQFDRVRAAQKAILDEAATDKWVNGQIPPGTREAEFRFEYEYHFLLIAVAQLDKAIRKLGFAGLDEDRIWPARSKSSGTGTRTSKTPRAAHSPGASPARKVLTPQSWP